MVASASTLFLILGLALRWQIFLRQQAIKLPYRKVFLLTWAGQFFNSILPGSTGGDVLKIYQICRLAPERKAAAASTVLVDRLSALVALLALATGSLLLDPRPLTFLPRPLVPRNLLLVSGIGLVVLAVAVGWLALRLTNGTLLHGRIARTIGAARNNLVANENLFAALLLAFGIHLLNFLTIYLFSRALGLPVSYPQILLMMPVIVFLLMFPVTINGHGLREVLLIAYFGLIGITLPGHPEIKVQEAAVALSLLTVANDLLWSVPGGVVYLLSFSSRAARPPKGN